VYYSNLVHKRGVLKWHHGCSLFSSGGGQTLLAMGEEVAVSRESAVMSI
jgi:hypothetical protein